MKNQKQSLNELARKHQGFNKCLEQGRRIAQEFGFEHIPIHQCKGVSGRTLVMWVTNFSSEPKTKIFMTLEYDCIRCFSKSSRLMKDFIFHLRIWIHEK